MAGKPGQLDDTAKYASAFAQVITNNIFKSPKLRDIWDRHASPAQKGALKEEKRKVQEGVFSTAAAGNEADKASRSAELFNAMIRSAEILTEVVAKEEPILEDNIVALFSAVKSDPRYAGMDIAAVYDAAEAPALAAAARKAVAVPPPKP